MQSAPRRSGSRVLRPRSGWFSAVTVITLIMVSLAVVVRISILLGARSSPGGAENHLPHGPDASPPPPLGGLGAVPLPPSL